MKTFILFDIFGCPGKHPLTRKIEADSAIKAVALDMEIQETELKSHKYSGNYGIQITHEKDSTVSILVVSESELERINNGLVENR